MNKIICFIKGIWRSITTLQSVSGCDYELIYENKDIQLLQCKVCNWFKLKIK